MQPCWNTFSCGEQLLRGAFPMLRGAVLILRGAFPMLRGAFPMLRGVFPIVRGAFPTVRGAFPTVFPATTVETLASPTSRRRVVLYLPPIARGPGKGSQGFLRHASTYRGTRNSGCEEC